MMMMMMIIIIIIIHSKADYIKELIIQNKGGI
jgi:hypothetical protein